MLLDMKVQASEYPGVSLLVEDAADSSLLQVEQIRSLIKRKVDLLIISANESEPVTPIAIEAYRAGRLRCYGCPAAGEGIRHAARHSGQDR